jgi:hypothetical protein
MVLVAASLDSMEEGRDFGGGHTGSIAGIPGVVMQAVDD